MKKCLVLVLVLIFTLPGISTVFGCENPDGRQAGDLPSISGLYRSRITDSSNRVLGYSRIQVDLVQDGRNFSGILISDDFKGEVWGRIEDQILKFEWYTDDGLGGKGTWQIGDDCLTMSGKWYKSGSRYVGGTWDLFRI